jgi:hypothetical protein
MRIAIIYPVPFLDSVPIVQSLAIKLSNKNNKIELFVVNPGQDHNAPSINNKNIKINTFNRKKLFKKNIIFNFLPNNLLFLYWCYKIFDKTRYDHVIGVDPAGLVISGLLSFFKSINFSYLSLELILWSDKNRMYKGYKLLESFFIKKTKNIIIQDDLRLNLLKNEYKLNKNKFLLFPNSPIGNAKIKKSKWLHKKLKIPINIKIILYMGSWSDEFYNNWITKLAFKNIDNCIIVVQSRGKITIEQNRYSKKIKFLNTPLSYSDLNKLASSASVGLAFYDSNYSENIKYVGKSSGKMTHYLFNGVPIICNTLPYWKQSLKKYKSGICIDNSAQLQSAIVKIMNNISSFSDGALSHFNKDLRINFSTKQLKTT